MPGHLTLKHEKDNVDEWFNVITPWRVYSHTKLNVNHKNFYIDDSGGSDCNSLLFLWTGGTLAALYGPRPDPCICVLSQSPQGRISRYRRFNWRLIAGFFPGCCQALCHNERSLIYAESPVCRPKAGNTFYFNDCGTAWCLPHGRIFEDSNSAGIWSRAIDLLGTSDFFLAATLLTRCSHSNQPCQIFMGILLILVLAIESLLPESPCLFYRTIEKMAESERSILQSWQQSARERPGSALCRLCPAHRSPARPLFRR